MKKLLLILFVVIFAFSACSCSVKNTEPKRQDTSDVSSVVSEKEPETIPLVIAKELFDRNIRVHEVFNLSKLDYEEEPVDGTFCPVKDTRFKTFADLDEYVRATFVKDVADSLLIERGLYKDINGVFCIDISKLEGRGYYVSWVDYDLEIVKGDKNTCEFTVTGSIEEPSNDPQREPYKKTAKAKNVDGTWLLQELVF